MILQLINISKSFNDGTIKRDILSDINLQIKQREVCALVGASGSGKSTLLHISGLISEPSSGHIIFDNIHYNNKISDKQRSEGRKKIGFVFQFHHLFPEFSALENLIIPQIINGVSKKIARKNAIELLDEFGLLNLQNQKPIKMSGGENQRIAILRAIVREPRLIIADEPTGNLDDNNSLLLFNFLLDIVKKKNLAMLVATHNINLANRADRTIGLD